MPMVASLGYFGKRENGYSGADPMSGLHVEMMYICEGVSLRIVEPPVASQINLRLLCLRGTTSILYWLDVGGRLLGLTKRQLLLRLLILVLTLHDSVDRRIKL